METQPVTTATDVETLLRELLADQYSDFLDSLRTWNTYEDAGILTRDKGLVLRFANGAEFQLTIVQSRWGRNPDARARLCSEGGVSNAPTNQASGSL